MLSPNLKIATELDFDTTLKFALAQVESLPFRHDYSEQRIREILLWTLRGDPTQSIILLSFLEGIPVGVLGCSVSLPLWTTEKLATELLFYVADATNQRRIAQSLLRAYKFWARKVGCSYIEYSVMKLGKEIHTIRKLK